MRARAVPPTPCSSRSSCVRATASACSVRPQRVIAERFGSLERRSRRSQSGDLAGLLPDEPLPPAGTLGFRVQRYGVLRWREMFSPRQTLALATMAKLVRDYRLDDREPEFGRAVRACLALVVDRVCDYLNSFCSWTPEQRFVVAASVHPSGAPHHLGLRRGQPAGLGRGELGGGGRTRLSRP